MAEPKNIPIITVKQPYKTSDGTLLYMGTSTEVQRDANGKYIPGSAVTSLRLYDTTFSPLGTDYKTVAIRESGKPWTFTKDGNQNTVAGKDLQQTLANPNSLMNVNLNNHITNSLGAPLQGVPAGQRNPNTIQDAQKAVGINTNTSTGTENPDGTSAINLDENQKNLDATKISNSDKTREVSKYPSSEYLKYPLTLKLAEQDCIKFTMLEYAPRQINLQAISKGAPLSTRDTNTNRKRGSTVVLPIQPSITDSNTVQWGSSEMNAAELIAASAAFGTIKGGGDALAESLSAAAELLQNANSDIKNAIGAGFADKSAGTKGLLTRITGGIVNPNMELLFEGPQLRSFTFNFTLSAREEKESKHIRNIIRFFKQGMSVKRASTSLFLKSPHTFEIKYMHKDKEHGWINKIKECALTSCNVNYTPSGNYATYYDGSMTSYELTLGFSELEPIYDDDYRKGSTTFETEIGY